MSKTSKALILAVAIASASILTAQAQTRPNVSGTWKMNRAKSKFGGDGGPESITIKFEQQEGSVHEWLTIAGQQGERTVELTYKTDGKEATAVVEGQEFKTTAKWEGDSLVIVFSDGGDGKFVRKFTLADGGKAMTIDVRRNGPSGGQADTVFLEKQ